MHHCSHLSQVSHLLSLHWRLGYDLLQAAACWYAATLRMHSDSYPSQIAFVASSGSQMDLLALHCFVLNLSFIF